MRYIEISHTYTIAVPADDMDVVEPLAREGMSIMEGFMSARAANMMDLRSDWKLLPKEYRPQQPVRGEDVITYEPGNVPKKITGEGDRIASLRMIELDADRGISFTEDVMGQRFGTPGHPWDQGMRIVPRDHDLFDAETEALRQEDKVCGVVDEAYNVECVGVKGHGGHHLWATRGDHGGSGGDTAGTIEGGQGSVEAGPDGD